MPAASGAITPRAEAGDPGPGVAAISARQALEAADPQSTASFPAAYQAMAYAPPAASPTDRANIVAASAPIPRSSRPAAAAQSDAATEINTVATKGAQPGELIATATRISAAKGNDVWLRIVMLAPSATTAMSVTMLGDSRHDPDAHVLRKPQAAIAMSFSDDPMHGLASDHFSGSAISKLEPTSFTLRTALLK